MTTSNRDRSTRRAADLVVVRHRDLLRLSGTPGLVSSRTPRGPAAGGVHGAARDPRYPSPRELRKVLSFALDLVLHLAIGVGVAAALLRAGQPVVVGAAAGLAGFVVASAVHRIVVQRLTSATLGKAVTGLRIIRDDTGGPATTGLLIMQWVFGVILIVAGLFS
ncbi:RDD family protein [Actinocatenispora thailandica]|uniref:RDD family protein n=1 Tax=Actinocatenispora thailandica TaxID=227318 RepID=UPI0031D716C2